MVESGLVEYLASHYRGPVAVAVAVIFSSFFSSILSASSHS